LKFVPEVVGEMDPVARLPVAGGWRIPFCNMDSHHVFPAVLCGLCYMSTVLGEVYNRVAHGQIHVPALYYLYPIITVLLYFPKLMGADSDTSDAAAVARALVLLVFWVHICMVRGQIRRALAIDGNIASDCAMSTVFCCIGTCTIIQMDDQLRHTTPQAPMVGLMRREFVKLDRNRCEDVPTAHVEVL